MTTDNSRSTSKIRIRKAALFAALLVIVVSLVWPGSLFAATGEERDTIKPIGDINAEAPKIKAKGAAMYSLQLDQFVYSKNENEKIDPYSITKALTCYLALENLDPEQVVTASAKSTQVYENGTTIYLKEGEKMTVKDLVYGAMLESGNDAAYALGEAVAGSEEAFAELMNKTVSEWGCSDTHFVNANGWKNKNHYTTAHDMAIITKNCFGNELLREISNTEEYTIPATNLSGARKCGNYMIKSTEGCEGITCGKTGSWDEDDCSIIVGFTREGLDEVIVLLGDTKKSRRKDVSKLIEFSKAVTPGFIVSETGDVVQTVKVRHGEFTKVGLAVDGPTVAYPKSTRASDIKIEIETEDLEAPLTRGAQAGTYTVMVDGVQVGQHALLITEDIKTGWLPSYLYISNEQTILIGKWLGAGLAVILLLVLITRPGRKRKKAKKIKEPKKLKEPKKEAPKKKKKEPEYQGKHFAGK